MMKFFFLNRIEDESGVSGTGIVAEGIQFDDGKCILHWRNYKTIGIYDSIEQLTEIHGHGRKSEILGLWEIQ